MTKASRNIVATLALLTMMAAGSTLAMAQATARQSSIAAPAFDKVQYQATSDKASARIQASDVDKKALLASVRSKNTDLAKALLLKNGFTAKQLEGAKIEFKDKTGSQGSPQKIKIEIGADCCPLVVVITINF